MQQHNGTGTTEDLVLYRLQSAKEDLKSAFCWMQSPIRLK